MLCSSCSNEHTREITTRQHDLISYDDYKKLPPFILDVPLICEEHNQKYDLFCLEHDSPICQTCRDVCHNSCDNIWRIQDLVYNVKSTVAYERSNSDIDAVLDALPEGLKRCKENEVDLKQQKDDLVDDVNKRTKNLIKQINDLKDNTLAQIEKAYNIYQREIQNNTEILQRNIIDYHYFVRQRNLVDNTASNFQIFMGIKDLEENVYKTKDRLSKLQNVSLFYEENTEIEDSIRRLNSLVVIRVPQKSVAIEIDTGDCKHALAPLVDKTEMLTMKDEFDLSSGTYLGCCTLSNGHMVAPNSKINHPETVILNEDGTLRSKVSELKASDVTPMNDTLVAVSDSDKKRISVIDAVKGRVTRSINLKHKPYGLVYHKGHILFCVRDKGVIKLTEYFFMQPSEDLVVDDSDMHFYSRIVASTDLVCYTSPVKHKIKVLDGNYDLLYSLDVSCILQTPFGITIDNDEKNIFVTGLFSHNLVVICPEDRSYQQLLGRDDGLLNPSVLHYVNETKELIVFVSMCGKVRKYRLDSKAMNKEPINEL